MVKRFVVRVENSYRLGASRAIDSWNASWLLGAAVMWCYFPGATILSGIWSFGIPLVEASTAFSILLSTMLISAGIMVGAGGRSSTILRECVVESYPLGVLVQTHDVRKAAAGSTGATTKS